jgi:predicted RNA-binding Zn-ribbon protein involved in translation (DUF1610 family)
MSEDQIFESYLNDVCPVCGSQRPEEDEGITRVEGGKQLSITYECESCLSVYVVGFRRRSNPIASEILINNTGDI